MVPAAVPRRAAGGALKKALLILVAALAVAFFGFRWPQRARKSETLLNVNAVGPLHAGAARVRIELPERPILAGYAGFRRARTATEPVYARAVVLEAGGMRATIAAIDTLLIPPGFWRPEGCSLIAATHTHTGPGGLWSNPLAGLLGAGMPDAGQRAAVEKALQQAVAQASAALAPAWLSAAREPWPAGPSRARSQGPIDPEIVALRLLRQDQSAVATIAIYAMHPTSAPHDALSADWPGQLDKGAAPTLVLQGAVGNSTWRREGDLVEPIAAEIDKLLDGAPPLSELPIGCVMRTAAPPPAEASRSVPWLLRNAVSNVLRLAFDPQATITTLRLGPVTLLGVPGEPVGEIGLRARPRVVVGLAGGYLGYVETPARWLAGEGESAKTYFGPELAPALGLWPR